MLCALGLFCACTTGNTDPITQSDEATHSLSDSTPTDPDVTIADFTIVYPATEMLSKEVAMNLRKMFARGDLSLELADDTEESRNLPYEILIGNTNREESALALQGISLKSDDYLIKFINNKIVVHAATSATYSVAIKELYNVCSQNSGIESVFTIDILYRYGNSPDGFLIDGVSIENFQIVMNNSIEDSEIRNQILYDIYRSTGYILSFREEDTPADYEIIVGNVAREEVAQAKDGLRDLDYAVRILNGKIVIVGGTDAVTQNAYELFVSDYLDTVADKKEFSSQQSDIVFRHAYPITSLRLLDRDISEYVIWAKSETDRAATVIREYINDLTGIKLEIVTDGEPQTAIVLGNVGTEQYRDLSANLQSDESIIQSVGTRLYLGTVENEDYYEDGPAVHRFFEDYVGYNLQTGIVADSTVDIREISDIASIDDDLMKIADEDFLAEIDAQADALRNSIVYAATDVSYTGTAYYVANDGNDTNDGLSPDTAWQTLDRVTHADELKNGDAVFFRRGDVFRGSVTAVAGVTYSAYGEGEKPKIWGSPVNGVTEYEWIEVAPDVWKYTYNFASSDIGAVILNHGEKVAVKICPDYSQSPVLNDWTNEPFSYKTMNTMDLYFYCATDEEFSPLVDTEFGYLYLCCKAGNPADVFESIEFNVAGHIFLAESSTTIDNLCIQYGGYHGILGGKNQCTIQNCEVSYVGGCYQGNGDDVRFGNGIELWGDGYEFTIRNCYVHHCFDTGITQQGGKIYNGIYYYNNLLEYTNANIEYFQYSDPTDTSSYIKNFYIYNNICRYAGYSWGAMRSSHVANGTGSYFHITGLGSCRRPRDDTSSIYNNIFQYSRKWLIRTLADSEDWLIPYYDNLFIEYEGGIVGSAANTTGDKHGVYSPLNYSGIDSWEYRKNTFYLVER